MVTGRLLDWQTYHITGYLLRQADQSFQCADLATQRCGFLNGQTQRIILYPCLGHFLFGPLADPVPDGI